jgi:hypothetical protein
LLEERAHIAASGDFRARVRFDLVDRPHHAFGLLAAADVARFTGVDEILAIEFGVAEGAGLQNLAAVATSVSEETGIAIRLVGFDTGHGLPAPRDHRDHPEIWSAGDFAPPDAEELRRSLPSGCRLVLGDVADTVGEFVATPGDAPIGFVSFDLDYYSSTRDALRVFDAGAHHLLPVVVTYFDDVIGGLHRIGSLFRNAAAGQLLAIREFNETRRNRYVDEIRVLRHRRPLDREMWLDRIYALHVLDHPLRTANGDRAAMTMDAHRRTAGFDWPL